MTTRTTTGKTADTADGRGAAALRALHVPGRPLVLPNVWDAASARAVEAAGFPVVATGSDAVAAALGYDDGEWTPAGEMLAAIARISRAVALPVTADVERGYGLEPAELVARLAEAGAAGCNLEDSDPRTGEMIDVAEQAAFLGAVRAAADDAGLDLVINARVDTYMNGSGDSGERLTESVRRGRRYLEAGADCVYPIMATEPETISALAEGIGGPVNVLFRPGMPSLEELAELGVARVSFGPGLHRAALAHTGLLLSAIRDGRDPFEPVAAS
ncbi:2-methylisocitrate lyase-like PEP mutase family enzyme [Streptosporangium becharense]|uniref:2-methylisocitrate lyase-like PEP mutase family enzyme n=1 Tax=Streptosporangium becharense TaxID=1816182 RepID=A0A7W9MEH0_9ACTN|nr:isocitrate lyase/phosphoenolpyruvate mutase family protein [Streptosporangium becharense]MBB2913699.1 2-methylisocitrate lyase-like PEP mutase family enzyme [Streptosporangium becharense]MBB5817780.1 2-methylisocitrate lyase-like PEP mutase family enzyme [Streptosporangium becharense]